LAEGILVTYFYFFGKNKERMLLVLGYGSLYNHTYEPNAEYKENPEEKTVEFFALRDVQKGEELSVNYSQGNAKDADPLWF
jgi:SET domain-containing protein